MQHIHVEFGPVDTLNPGCGYQVKIVRATTGMTLLNTATAPDTGTALLTPADCLRVVSMYAREVPVDHLALKACRLLLEDGVECECGDLDVCARCAAQAAASNMTQRKQRARRPKFVANGGEFK